MSTPKLVFLILFLYPLCKTTAQTDSAFALTEKLSQKYLHQTSAKIERYSKRVDNKTQKTLIKLCRWETKIQNILQKANPSAAERLFSPSAMSFKKILVEYNKGINQVQQYESNYDKYLDDLTTQLKYLDSNRSLISKKTNEVLSLAKNKTNELQQEEARNEAFQKMIKERRQQLINEAIKHIGKNKYLQKINKEGYYYAETIKNYKQLFKEPGKAEETAKKILNKIPAFKEFVRKNNMLASLLNMPQNSSANQSLAGLQTRAGVNSLIQNRIAAGGPNAMAEVRQNLQAAQSEINKLKDKLLKAGSGSSESELPDFKPNTQKAKTFLQRIEYGFNLQFGKRNNWIPGTTDIALTVGYRLNDKSVIGIGASYKLGMGSIERIRFSHEGVGLRSYLDWKLKKQFFLSGGFELNHFSSFKNLQGLIGSEVWQESGLIGISKKISMKTKFSKGTKLQLMHDMLYRNQQPIGQPWIFRVGYDLK